MSTDFFNIEKQKPSSFKLGPESMGSSAQIPPSNGQPSVGYVDDSRPSQPSPVVAPRHRRDGFSLHSFLVVLFGNWRLVMAMGLGVIVATALAMLVLPPHYASEAKLLVRLGRESVVIDPTARIGQAAVPMEGRDKEINSEIEMLKSRKLTESIVSALGANRILGYSADHPVDTRTISSAITLVEDKLAIEAIPESNILSIRFEARDPELARDVVSRLIEDYLNERGDIYRERGDLKFFKDQLEAAREEQTALQRKIQDLRDSTGVSDATQQRLTLLTRLDQIQREIDADVASRKAQAQSLDAVTRQLGSAAATRQHQAQLANDSLLESMIQSLETQRSSTVSSLAWVNDVDVKAQKLRDELTLSTARVTRYAEAYEQARIDQAMGQERLSNISIAEPPVLPLTPKSPNRWLIAVAGAFLALTLGVGSAFVAEGLNHTVRRASDLQAVGLPQVVSIPTIGWELSSAAQDHEPAGPSPLNGQSHDAALEELNGDAPMLLLNGAERLSSDLLTVSSHPRIVETDHEGSDNNGIAASNGADGDLTPATVTLLDAAIRPVRPFALSPRMLASMNGVVERLMPYGPEIDAPRFIGVVGARRGQGTSTIAMHLAVRLAQQLEGPRRQTGPNRVLLFDANVDSHDPVESPFVGAGKYNGQEKFRLSAGNSARKHKMLDLLTAGSLREQSPFGTNMPQLLRAIGQQYQHVIIDLPSIVEHESSARLAGLCNAVVLVCKANVLRVETAEQVLSRLREANANVVVGVLNQRHYPVPEWIYSRS